MSDASEKFINSLKALKAKLQTLPLDPGTDMALGAIQDMIGEYDASPDKEDAAKLLAYTCQGLSKQMDFVIDTDLVRDELNDVDEAGRKI